MNEVVKPKKLRSEIDRVALSKETMGKLDEWLDVLSSKLPGLKMKRSELAEWIIKHRATDFSDAEITQIADQFYDQLQLANWILRQVKAAKATGKPFSIADIMRGNNPSK